MLSIIILLNFLFNSLNSSELDFLIKDKNLIAANKKSSVILKDSVIPNNYKIGPGDEFFINVLTNNLSISEYLVVSPLGDIVLPHLGVLNIDKFHLSDAFNLIKSAYADKYETIDFNITLSDIRKFQLLVVGLKTGPFYIKTNPLEKVSDVYRKLLHKEYISNNISKRNIALNRSDEVSYIDVMKLNYNHNAYNPYLIEGDVIELKKIYQTINIHGAVNYPGTYEYKQNESLFSLIKITGGFTENVDSNNVVISRINNQHSESKIYLDNYGKFKTFILEPDDYIMISNKKKSISRNLVKIHGAVVSPGSYVLDDDMTLKDLLIKAGGYNKNADSSKVLIKNKFFKDKKDLEFERIKLIPANKRTTSEISYLKSRNLIDNGIMISNNIDFTQTILNYKLNPNDSVEIPILINYIEILGGVKNPGRYPFLIDKTINDYIDIAGGKSLSSTNKIFIIDNTNEKNRVRNKNIKLKNGDILFIENKVDSNFWISLKESMGIIGQLATLIAVIQSANN